MSVTQSDLSHDKPVLAGPIIAGAIVVCVFFAGFLGWAAHAPLATAALAPGTITVDTNRKSIQHLEGGIIARILVAEGQRVSAGEALIEIDPTEALSRLSLLRGQLRGDEEQLDLLEQEIDALDTLLREGLATKARLLALQRRRAELGGDRQRILAEITTAEAVLARCVIRSTWDGLVVGLQVHTPGGVIAPGEMLMSIVPLSNTLIIEAHLSPLDIDVVHADQDALIRITPFNQRVMPPIRGTVLSVSADNMRDQATGQPYYLTRIAVDNFDAALNGARLYPGMPTEVMILTGERTLLDTLLEPLMRSIQRAFREQ